MEFETGIVWKDVRQDIAKVNPTFATIIDDLDPPSSLCFIRAKYHYGENFWEDGSFYIPQQHSNVRDLVNYAHFPLSIVTKKVFEIFVPYKQQVIPIRLFCPGRVFGAFESITKLPKVPTNKMWKGQAGSRLVFALPSISNQIGLRRLKKYYAITDYISSCSNLFEHYTLFKQIACSHKLQHPWQGELILFSKEWFQAKAHLKYLSKIKEYLIDLTLKQINWPMNYGQINFVCQKFEQQVHDRYKNMRMPLYLYRMLGQLMSVALGELPGVEVCLEATGDEFLPLQEIQHALIEIYELKDYQPTLMRAAVLQDPHHFNFNTKIPCYYSLSLPFTVPEKLISKYRNTTIMQDIKQIKAFTDTYLKDTGLLNFEKKYPHLEYFHIESDLENIIKSSATIPLYDHNIISPRYSHLKFCETSPFWRGCILLTC